VTQAGIEIKLELLGDNGKLKGRQEKTHAGVATFDNRKIDPEGEYPLRASACSLPAVDGDAFRIHERPRGKP
jgi:hypothetical protein